MFGEIADISKLNEYGITYTYEGKTEWAYKSLYSLGMGSGRGINTDTYTLNIDYNTLKSKINSQNSIGIYGEFYQYADSKTQCSSAYSEIIVNYSDKTSSIIKTDKTVGYGTTIGKEVKDAWIYFEKNKEISSIQLILHLYDADYGGAIRKNTKN